MIKFTYSFLSVAFLSFSSPVIYAEEKETENSSEAAEESAKEMWDSEKRQAALRVQLFLDEKGFGPGKIDGYWGGFSEKAAERWNATDPESKIVSNDEGDLDLKMAKDLPFEGDLIINYEITEEDQELIGKMAEEPEGLAEQEELPYTSLLEVVAEKFHADPDFLVEANGLDEDPALKVGDSLKVPNVAEPFEVSKAMQLAEDAAEGDEENAEENAESGDKQEGEKEMFHLTVLRDARVVEVRKDDKLELSFPISPGASDNQSPKGEWKVTTISWMPEFRWDKSMLESGERSNDSYMLPPGPNNPVGIVWIGISADGIGLHGTSEPDAIGRNSSHGCIRLSNWDALKLGETVTVGSKVVIK